MRSSAIRASGAAFLFFCSLFFAALLAGCAAPRSASPDLPNYRLEGTVVSVNKPQQLIVVNHKAIPGFMPAMTMPYPAASTDAAILDRLTAGDQITADVIVDNNGARLQHIVVTKPAGAPGASAPSPSHGSEASTLGEKVPDFTFLNQDGKQIDLGRFRGKAVLLTFIYTRCPLPDQCPLLTHNFAVVEKSLARTPALYAKTQLLSISFDPEHDTPAVLRAYAGSYDQTSFGHWQFAALPAAEIRKVTSFFDILLSDQNGQINHSLCTVILTPQGTVAHIYFDNDWKPSEMVVALQAAAAGHAIETTASSPAR